MLGGLFFVPMVSLLGILIPWYRRDPHRFLDGPAEDAPLRLMRWGIGLLAPQRAEWGQAMLGELGYIEGQDSVARHSVWTTMPAEAERIRCTRSARSGT
ncbi:MAG TPA: hypothetical protein VGD83_04865 [Streptosporangiaceae bacterium]